MSRTVTRIGIPLAGISTPTQSHLIANHYKGSQRFQGRSAFWLNRCTEN